MKKFEMLNIICKDCELTAKEKLVAQYFVYKSNQKGACYPCVATIAEECCISRRTVQRATKKLAEKEYIVIEKQFKCGRQTSNLYSFNTLLLAEKQREKELAEMELCDQLELCGIHEIQMETIDFEALLQMQEVEHTEKVAHEEEEIDLDDLIAFDQECGYIEFLSEGVYGAYKVPFEELGQQDIDEVEVKQPEKRKQKMILFSVTIKVIRLIYIFLVYQDKFGVGVLYIVIKDSISCGIIEKLVFINCRASRKRKIMGAFFPP